MKEFGLSDAELFPLLGERGEAMLRRLREHPHAPRYNWRTGERLTAEMLAGVRDFAAKVRAPRESWGVGRIPKWLPAFLARCRDQVPFYRERREWSVDFTSLPLTRREDVRLRPWAFVPDDQPLETLVTYTTSGTTGTRLQYLATPELPAKYLPLFEQALASVGVQLQGGERVSLVHVCAQRGTVLLCSVSSYLNGSGFAKVNLDPADWNAPDDAVKFLDACDPELFTGDPFALWRLVNLPVRCRPKAIISGGTALSDGLRRQLMERFGCPVLEMYSMNESGPIAFSADGVAMDILSPDLYVEVVGHDGKPCPPGELGEIVLTGGLNNCLPLVRYATGDRATFDFSAGGMPRLRQLHARQPVAFRDTRGRWFSSVDICTALASTSVVSISVHQNPDGSLAIALDADQPECDQAIQILLDLFGPQQPFLLTHSTGEIASDKRIKFSSALEPV